MGLSLQSILGRINSARNSVHLLRKFEHSRLLVVNSRQRANIDHSPGISVSKNACAAHTSQQSQHLLLCSTAASLVIGLPHKLRWSCAGLLLLRQLNFHLSPSSLPFYLSVLVTHVLSYVYSLFRLFANLSIEIMIFTLTHW